MTKYFNCSLTKGPHHKFQIFNDSNGKLGQLGLGTKDQRLKIINRLEINKEIKASLLNIQLSS